VNPATFSFVTLVPALPEIVLLALACALVVIDAFLRKRDGTTTYWLTLFSLLVCAVMTVLTVRHGRIVTFHGMFVADPLAQIVKTVMLLTVAGTIVLSRGYLETRRMLSGEFLCLALFGAVGMMVMISANHFLTLYLGLELMALTQYAMVALDRDSAKATEASMKYFVLGALSSGLLLYGLSMLYGATGSLELTQVAFSIEHGNANATLAAFGLVFVVAGIAFKLGAAPFHMWIPDVYHGAATPTTIIIGGAPKLAAFVFIMRLLATGLQGMTGDWQQMLVFLALVSMAVGNVVAIAQGNVKRMLAYSTISNMGYLLLGVLAGSDTGYSAALFYAIAYTIMTLGSFGMILLLSRAGFEADRLEDF
jgi:NADH-quinone oxidoreductase subunit N